MANQLNLTVLVMVAVPRPEGEQLTGVAIVGLAISSPRLWARTIPGPLQQLGALFTPINSCLRNSVGFVGACLEI